jgi:hypothetical protein
MSEQNEQTEILREILKWQRFAGFREVKSVLESILNTPEKKLAYQLSDGTRGTREVIQQSGLKSDISKMWKEWRKQGLGETVSVQRGERFKRSFNLEDFGIEFPEPALQAQAAQTMTAVPAQSQTPASPQQSLSATVVESP